MCAQRRLKSDCACAQSDLSLRCPHEEILYPRLSKMHQMCRLVWIINGSSCLQVRLCDPFFFFGGGWVRQRCRVSYITGAFTWHWLTVEQSLQSLQQVRVKGECFISSVSSPSFIFLSYRPSLSSPLFRLPLFSHSLGDDTKWSTRADVSLNPTQSIL